MYPQINNKSNFLTQRSRSINPAAEALLPLGTIINKHKTPMRSTNNNTYGIRHQAAPSMDLFRTREVDLSSSNNVFDHHKVATATGDHSSVNLLDSQDGSTSFKEDRRSGLKFGSTILKTE